MSSLSLLAGLFLYLYENKFLDNTIRSSHWRVARSFNSCNKCLYIDENIQDCALFRILSPEVLTNLCLADWLLLHKAQGQPPNLVNLSWAENFRSASLSSRDYVRHNNPLLLVISYLLLLASLSHMCWATGGTKPIKFCKYWNSILCNDCVGVSCQVSGWKSNGLWESC